MSLALRDLTLKKVLTSTMLESGGARSFSAYSATLTSPSLLPVSTSYHGPLLCANQGAFRSRARYRFAKKPWICSVRRVPGRRRLSPPWR
ncbi:Os05g0499450 [Oryza sativa Japonica Group]|uniref:Os05g0499450 protein n=1 Tax=Oryza sativa subsp. japonica TaxID=39947 RepID=A0A0P0WP90_ORYSJ|nr:hypothetical protein EE612_030422 [Oryza sativa]BAS94746.1 Os05g0499450 [Oryza sativa Japonica Group]